jgi:hypothetical protein
MEEFSSSWHSYPKSVTLGHRYVAQIMNDDVIVEEKIDGSQFSFGSFGGEIRCRSKGAVLNIEAPEKMFAAGVDVVKELASKGLLKDGWTYRGEYLARPRHNVLAYNRIPAKHFIGFDINPSHETYLSYEEKAEAFAAMGLECVPRLFAGRIANSDQIRGFLQTDSILGGQKIEGVVIKNYSRFTPDGKAMMAKFVSEAFKEVHSRVWSEDNPGQKQILEQIIAAHRTPARWQKAVQKLTELGQATGTPADIGALIKLVRKDVEEECREDISARLYSWAQGHIERGITGGLPDWYKEQLMKKSFEDVASVAA